MPAAQALGIFASFKECLINSTGASVDKHISKKQKSGSNRGSIATATLIAVYFVEFTNSLRLNQHQLRNFEEHLLSIYSNFIKICISTGDKTNSNILPALQVHSVLVSVFFDTYFTKLIVDEQEWLAKSYVEIFQSNVKGNNLQSRAVLVTCVRISISF